MDYISFKQKWSCTKAIYRRYLCMYFQHPNVLTRKGPPRMRFKLEVGVISPYKGQVHLIKDLLADPKNVLFHDMGVKTVDGFQGR